VHDVTSIATIQFTSLLPGKHKRAPHNLSYARPFTDGVAMDSGVPAKSGVGQDLHDQI
jgi:hypothetical protein